MQLAYDAALQFEEIIRASNHPVLIEFGGKWCFLCQELKPVIEELEREYTGAMTVISVEVENNMQLVDRFQVFGTPTLILFVDGYEVERMMGSSD